MVRSGSAIATLMMLATFATAQPSPRPVPPSTPRPIAPAAPIVVNRAETPRAPWESTSNAPAAAPSNDGGVYGTLSSDDDNPPSTQPVSTAVSNSSPRHSGEEEEGILGDAWQGCCNLARTFRRSNKTCDCCDDCCAKCGYFSRFSGQVSSMFGSFYTRATEIDEPQNCWGNMWESRGKTWGSIDLLYWKISGDPLPPLVSSSPTVPLTPVNVAGNLPDASIVFGNELGNADPRSGLRGNFGFWLNSSHTLGFQMGGFFMESQREINSFTSDGSTILARPFLDVSVIPNVGKAQLIGYPDTVTGQIDINDNSTLTGYDLAFRGIAAQDEWWRLDALLGFRQLRMTEQLLIQQQITAGVNGPVNIGVPAGTTINSYDRFDTSNTFRGIQTGISGEARLWKKLTVSGTGKVSIGVVDQGVGIDGATVIAAPGLPINGPLVGGLLALNSNIGAYHRSDFSMVPELTLSLNYQLTQRSRLKFGYDLIYLPNVQRAGGAIPKDLGIDVNRIPPQNAPPLAAPARPSFPASGNAGDLFLQGIHAGIEFRF